MNARQKALRALLDDLYAEYHDPALLGTDPLGVVHTFDDPADREVVALIAASFAFGNVKAIQGAVDTVLRPLRPHPARALAAREPKDWARLYRGFVYRWVRAEDLRLYLAWIGGALRTHGSLGAMWQSLDEPNESTILPTLQRWIEALTEQKITGLRTRKRTLARRDAPPSPLPSGAHLLLTPPAKKSGCKRMNLFLRWVCRPNDGIDLGLWNVAPSRLIMPVDTHVLAVAELLKLTTRKTADLRTAVEITDALRAIAPDDPTRYDFSMTRPGIMRLREVWGEKNNHRGTETRRDHGEK